jgi:hypothetical protein
MMNENSLEGSAKKLIPLTDEQICDNIKTFLFAGHDTTASALTWAIYLLSKNPDGDVNCEAHNMLDVTVFSRSTTPALLPPSQISSREAGKRA